MESILRKLLPRMTIKAIVQYCVSFTDIIAVTREVVNYIQHYIATAENVKEESGQ